MNSQRREVPLQAHSKHVFPVYFLVDETREMHKRIEDLNNAIEALDDALLPDPFVASHFSISVFGFASSVRLIADPINRLGIRPVSPLTARGGMPSYLAAFRDLKERIEPDIRRHKAAGRQVFRPFVFFSSERIRLLEMIGSPS